MGYYALDATFQQSHTDTGESEHGVMNISREWNTTTYSLYLSLSLTHTHTHIHTQRERASV